MTCDATTSLADMTPDELAALPMEELRARMEDAAVRVMATDRAILSMGVSEIAARYRCSADVARRALMAARSAQLAFRYDVARGWAARVWEVRRAARQLAHELSPELVEAPPSVPACAYPGDEHGEHDHSACADAAAVAGGRCAAEDNGMERCGPEHLRRGVACSWCRERAGQSFVWRGGAAG